MAEVICLAALEITERHFLPDSKNKASNRFFSLFRNRKQISSRDSSIVLHNFLEHEIHSNARTLLEKFTSEKKKNKLKCAKLKNGWWTSPAFSRFEKIGGPEFCSWISECVPSYMLEIDSNKFSDVKLEGLKKSEENRWELVLTHSQMVSLAGVLDIYYEDLFTLPNKRLSCYAVAKSNMVLTKGSSLLKLLRIVLVSGIFLVTFSVLRKLYLPHLPMRMNCIRENAIPSASDINCIQHYNVGSAELEACCVSIIQRIKDSFGWSGEIRINSGGCAWIGGLPTFLMNVDDPDSKMVNLSPTTLPFGTANDEEMKALEDVASYQVVLSSDWKIIGFKPTNRVAVNSWAANPLAKELYGGKNLSPGLIEPGLKFRHSIGVVVLELLISLNPNSYFALVKGY